jgi:hypothetical protein
MICGDRYNLAPPPSHSLLMMRSSSREGRIETVEAYSDRELRFSIDQRGRPFLACAARTTPERLSRFIAQLTATRFWTIQAGEPVEGLRRERLIVDLDPAHRCQFQMSPEDWAASRTARAVQGVIDELAGDLCEGRCPDPALPEPLLP